MQNGRTEVELPTAEEHSGEVGELTAQIDERLGQARARLAEIVAAHSAQLAHITRLEDARAQLTARRKRSRKRSGGGAKTAAQRAGTGNVRLVADLLARCGPLTVAEATRQSEKNNGTVTYALRALEEDGVARRTGRRVRGSAEFELTPRGRRGITRPGD